MGTPKFLRRAACVAAVVAVFVALPAAAGADLVQNGSFESGYPGDNICGAWWYTVGYGCDPAGTAIPGWLETGDGVDWHSPGPPGEPVAQDGIHLIDLIGGGAGKIQQDVPTTTDAVYNLSFYYTTHSLFACSAPVRSAIVTAGSSSLVVTSEPSNVWKPASITFAGGRRVDDDDLVRERRELRLRRRRHRQRLGRAGTADGCQPVQGGRLAGFRRLQEPGRLRQLRRHRR